MSFCLIPSLVLIILYIASFYSSALSSRGEGASARPTFTQEEIDRVLWAEHPDLDGKPVGRILLDLPADVHSQYLSQAPAKMTEKVREHMMRAIELESDRRRENTPSIDEEFTKFPIVFKDSVIINNTNNTNVHYNSATSTSNDSSIILDSVRFDLSEINTKLLFQAYSKRWEVIKYIVTKNIEIFCTKKFDVHDKDHMALCLKVLGLDYGKQENHTPCLDYLNLIPEHDKSDSMRPTILRNSYAMVNQWREDNDHDRVTGYLQRRLLTYYNAVYLKYYNNDYKDGLQPYFCLPQEEELRQKYKLLPLKETFKAANFQREGEDDPELKWEAYNDHTEKMEIDSKSFYVTGNEVLYRTNRTELFGKDTKEAIERLVENKDYFKKRRNEISHEVNGAEAKMFCWMMESLAVSTNTYVLKQTDKDVMKVIKTQFRHLFGSGYGQFTDNDTQLSKYILTNTIEGEYEDNESIPSSSQT